MLDAMATRPTAKRRHIQAPAQPRKGQFNVRLDAGMHDDLLDWLARLNKGRRIPLTQSDLVRGVLAWAIDHEPDFERK